MQIADADRLPAWRHGVVLTGLTAPILIGSISRVFSLVLVIFSYAGRTPSGAGPPQAAPFAVWDGAWYVSIATSGYHSQPIAQAAAGPLYDIAFFPAWPTTMAVLSLFGRLPVGLIGGLAANTLFVVACPFIYRLLVRVVDRRVALWTIAFLAFSPAAYVFSLAYSESLALFVATMAVFSGRSRWLWLAQLTRVTGGAAAAAVAVEAWMDGRRRAAAVAIMIPVLAFGLWIAVAAVLMGRPDGYLLGSPSWNSSLDGQFGPFTLLQSPAGAAVAVYLALLALGVGVISRVSPSLATYAAYLLVAAIVLGRWETMPRYVLLAFPALAGVASAFRFDNARAGLLGLFIAAQVLLVQMIARDVYSP